MCAIHHTVLWLSIFALVHNYFYLGLDWTSVSRRCPRQSIPCTHGLTQLEKETKNTRKINQRCARTLRGYYWQQRNDGQLGAEDDAESFD
jgi:hypothetical protein